MDKYVQSTVTDSSSSSVMSFSSSSSEDDSSSSGTVISSNAVVPYKNKISKGPYPNIVNIENIVTIWD